MSEFPGTWVRSSFCEAGACVEVAQSGGDVLVRDGKRPDQPHLRFSSHEWANFLDAVCAGEIRLG